MYFTKMSGYVDLIAEKATFGHLTNEKLLAFPILVPGLSEQRAITDFLDRETARIDALIAKKQRLIELLQEKRTALISHAVTKGLDAGVAMKKSGVPWLGEVPAHWEAARLRFVAEIQTGLTLGQKYEDQILITRPYLRVANVQDGFLDLADITEIEVPMYKVKRHELRPGDVLMTEGGDFDKLGRGYVWDGQISGCLHQNHVFAVRPLMSLLDPHFLAALMTSAHGKHYFTSTSQQTTNLATTNVSKLKQFPLFLPPIEEQRQILDSIRRQTDRLETLIRHVEDAARKLQEYRTALISAAVTGKIDVRKNDHG
jgi:type I restriction enzyme S subunit